VQHHYEGHWKGWALKIETFLGPEMARVKRVPFGAKKVEIRECHLGPKKSRFSGPTPSNAPSNDVALLKTIKYNRHKNNWYIGSFMYPSAVVYCCVLLLCVVVCCCGLLCVVLYCCVLEGWEVSL
jgi:hypothetical protein